MPNTTTSVVDRALERQARFSVSEPYINGTGSVSAVSWGAISAGAFVTAALSLILLALGTGLGLSSISPWSGAGESEARVKVGAIVWFIILQIVASAMGGYMAGRLRTKSVAIHTDEVYFRDTAHGFLAWAVGLVITAAFLTSAATSMIANTAAVGATRGGQSSSGSLDPNAYFVDTLLRTDLPSADRNDAPIRTEVGIILANGLRRGEIPTNDKSYLVKVITANTGISQAEAETRITQGFDAARQRADNVGKAVAHSLYWLFLALLIGAFCASFAATIGGRQRDHVPVTN